MEEDIKVVEELKEIFIHLKKYGWINDIKRDVDTDKVIQALENLIQENKELKEHLQKYYNGELYTAKQLKNIEENQRKYFINKSKVKEKIKYIEENYSEHSEFSIGKSIEFLQELLEEGE